MENLNAFHLAKIENKTTSVQKDSPLNCRVGKIKMAKKHNRKAQNQPTGKRVFNRNSTYENHVLKIK